MASLQTIIDNAVACLEEQYALADDVPTPGFIGALPGALVVADYVGGDDCPGMAWVRLTAAFNSTTFPVPDEGRTGVYAPPAYTLEVGAFRCAPMPDSLGGEVIPPTPEEQAAAVALQVRDLEVMRKAIRCCLANVEHVLGTYVPVGPQGDIVGGYWTAVISGM